MIKKRLHQLLALVKDLCLFTIMKFGPSTNSIGPVVFVDFKNPNLYHRYFYNLLKTFRIAGYEIVYPMDFSKFRNLRNGDVYLALMFKEKGFLRIKNTKTSVRTIVLEDQMFSADYYHDYFSNDNKTDGSFHVPMSFHPYMYHHNLWDIPLDEHDRINALFSFGNFDRDAYKKINESPFDIINRAELIEFFAKMDGYLSIRNKNELDQIVLTGTNSRYIFIEKYNFEIQLKDVRHYLSKFRYFLCCPGVFAPLSHNFTEALSSGAVPVIQESYADVIYPALEHGRNAFIFKNLDDLQNILEKELFNLSDEEYISMKSAAKEYYESYLKPESAAKNIIKNLAMKKKMYLNASERSVKLLHQK